MTPKQANNILSEQIYKEPTEIINNEFSQKIGKILDDCFCGEITRDEAIKSIWSVKCLEN